jgi:hypothetical protein
MELIDMSLLRSVSITAIPKYRIGIAAISLRKIRADHNSQGIRVGLHLIRGKYRIARQ